MPSMYHDGQRQLQDQFDTRRMADQMEQTIVHDFLNDKQKAFVESADMFFLATADEMGRPSCSYKGGEPGFVHVVDPHTLAIPNYDGNGMYVSWGNVLKNPNVALLFIDFFNARRMRVHGAAEIRYDDPLLKEFHEAQFVVRIKLREVFGNCPRYIHKYQLVERSKFVPHEGCETPVPDWKKGAEVKEILPKKDAARRTS
jgi:predicted pyridoxine 5'-phosphate oxidase superfamily flavin-nucleotide-binding protein